MIRALHLIENPLDEQSEAGAGQLRTMRDSAGAPMDVRTVALHGTAPVATVPFDIVSARRAAESVDLVHAFGERALAVALLAAGKPLVYSPRAFPSRVLIRWLRAAVSVRDVQIVCPTDTMRRALVTRGVPIERCHLIRPGVDFATVRTRRDPNLRRTLGFDEQDYVILAAGESSRAAGHDHAAWAVSILHVLDPAYRMLLLGRGPMVSKVQRFASQTRQPRLVSVAAQSLDASVRYPNLLAAADAVLVTADAPVTTLSIATSMASGLPIVSVVTPTVAELLEDRHTALMLRDGAPRKIAQRILDLRADPGLQWSICDMARTEAYEYFSMTRFLTQWQAVYGQISRREKVEVPQQAPGAGARFHGRA